MPIYTLIYILLNTFPKADRYGYKGCWQSLGMLLDEDMRPLDELDALEMEK